MRRHLQALLSTFAAQDFYAGKGRMTKPAPQPDRFAIEKDSVFDGLTYR
ncbi:MAG: hypothetical protein WBD20_17545 [Pirellulaceae bacterium]